MDADEARVVTPAREIAERIANSVVMPPDPELELLARALIEAEEELER